MQEDTPNPYAELDAQLRVLCEDFHNATLRAVLAAIADDER